MALVVRTVDLSERERCEACGDLCAHVYWETCGKCGYDHKLCEECWGIVRPTMKLCVLVREDRVALELMR